MPASEWRTISLVIDNGHIRVTSDSQTEQKNTFGKKKFSSSTNKYHFFFKFKTMMTFIFYLFSGVLERAPCGMKLGWGEGYENFNGCIDEVIKICCPLIRALCIVIEIHVTGTATRHSLYPILYPTASFMHY